MYTRRQQPVASGVNSEPYGFVFKNISGTPALDMLDNTKINVLAMRQHTINPLNMTTAGAVPVPSRNVYGTIYKSFGQGTNVLYGRKDTVEKQKSYYLGYIIDRAGDPGDSTFDFQVEVKYRDA